MVLGDVKAIPCDDFHVRSEVSGEFELCTALPFPCAAPVDIARLLLVMIKERLLKLKASRL